MSFVNRNCIIILSMVLIMSMPYVCEAIDVEELVDQYGKLTDLQKTDYVNKYKNEPVSFSAVVSDVKPSDTFDERTDTSQHYYKILTDVRTTKAGNPYDVVVFYKDVNNVKDINKGQKIEKEGRLLTIIDQRLDLSIWLYEESLTQEEKAVFK